jgi:hypothetical protein
MERGKAQRIIVWGLGLIVVALLLCFSRLVFESLRERVFLDPSQAIIGRWVPADAPESIIEFTEKVCTIHYTDDTFTHPYRFAVIDGRRLLILGPNTTNPTEHDKELIEVPFSFESRDILVIRGSRSGDRDRRLRRKD